MAQVFKIYSVIVICLAICVLVSLPASAQQLPSAAQEGGSILKQKPFEGFKKEPEKPEIEEEEEVRELPQEKKEERRFYIERINVEGNTVLPDESIWELVYEYENRDLSLSDLIELAEKITNLYHAEGYITSQSYVPPQTIENNTVTIQVIEGKYGHFYIEGAVHSNEALLRRRLKKKDSEVLNYSDLRDDLLYLSRSRDRTVRTILTRGEEPGTTDAIVKVKDVPTTHVFTSYDNTGNRTTGNWRLTLGLQDSSLLGWDDQFMLRWTRSDTYNLYGWIVDYIVPVNESDTVIGFTGSFFKSNIGGDFQDFYIESWSSTFSPFIEHPIFALDYNTGRLSGTLNLGIDIKDAKTEILSAQDSRDRLRILRSTFTLEEADSIGRTTVTNELNVSYRNFLGSMKRDDDFTSRERGGADFIKYNYSILRVNPLFLSTFLLLNVAGQATNNPLVSSEQYRIGGMYTVRGYAEGDALGDYGTNASAELRYPLNFIPDDFHIMGFHPRRELQGTAFVDWGFAHFNDPTTADRHNSNLLGVGFGGRVNFMDTLQGRYDIAWPMKDSSTYGRVPKAHMSFAFQEPTLQQYENHLEAMMLTRATDRLNEAKSDVPPDMKEIYHEAQMLEETGQYEEAKNLYAKVVEMRDQIVFGAETEIKEDIENEREAHSAFEEAQKHYKKGDLHKAREEYEKVLRMAEGGKAND